MTTHALAGRAKITDTTPAGKQLVAKAMYDRGLSFLRAAILLRKQSGYQWPVLYLVCQGTELILKAFLLSADYDRYEPLLPKQRTFAHDLEKLATAVHSELGRKPLNQALSGELHKLKDLYTSQFLRYADLRDLLVGPDTVKSERVFKWVLRLPAARARLK